MNAGFSGGVNAGIEAAIDRGADAVLLLNNDMVVEPGFLGPLVAACREPGVAAACSQILFAESPDRVWYAGATFRPRRGHHGRNVGFGEAPLPASVQPYPRRLRLRWGDAHVARGNRRDRPLRRAAVRLSRGSRLVAPAARRAGKRSSSCLRASCVIAFSASTGGESSPTSLYYDTRNGLVVSERYAPLGRVGTAIRRGESVLAHLAQGAMSHRRVAATRAVLAGWRDARRRHLGRISM